MKRTFRKLTFPVMILSLLLNLFFGFSYSKKQQEKRFALTDVVDQVLVSTSSAAELITIDENHPDYKNHIITALREITISHGMIKAYESDMPLSLVSWFGGIEVGLRNGVYGIDHEGFKDTLEEIINFNDGYFTEISSISSYSTTDEKLKKIDDVLTSKKYMGNNYMK